VHRSFVRSFVALAVLAFPAALASQTPPAGGTQTQAQQGPCLPEDEPCGGGGTNSVTVLPDDGVMTVASSSSGNVAEFTVLNNYGSSYTYNLTCSAIGVGTCTAIKNVSGTTITSINLPGGGQAEVMVHFSAGVGPTSGTVRLTANNGLWSDNGLYSVTVSTPLTPAKPGLALINHNRVGIDRGLCFTTGAGAAAGNSCGDLFITHGMPAYRTMGRDRSLTLLYNSAVARGQVLEAATITQPLGSSTPTRVTATLRVGRQRDSADYAGVAGGNSAQIVMGDRLMDTLPTGVYVDTLVVRNTYPSSVFDTMLIDTVVVVNNRFSEYGRGWSLVGVERLIFSQPSGSQDLLWVAGDGSALRYRKVADSIWLAPAIAFRDSIIKSGSTYTRRLQHKVRVVYDLSGRHLQTINRYGHVTQFAYDTVSGVVRLKSIRMPGNDAVVRQYTFTWSAAPARLLDRITDPGGRQLNVTRSGTAVTVLTDPDGQQTQFQYGGPDSLLSARKVANPVVAGGWSTTSYSYAGRSKLARMRTPAGPIGGDSTIFKYVAWQANGLDTAVAGLTAAGTATPPNLWLPTTIDGPAPGSGDLYSAWLDRFGQPIRTSLSWTGATTIIARDSVNFPALVTRVTYPNGRVAALDYDALGRLRKQVDNVTQLGGAPARVMNWSYNSSAYPYVPSAVSDAFGRTTSYSLHSTWGVPTSVTAPNGLVTTFDFTTLGLVQGVTENDVDVWVQANQADTPTDLATTFEYDGMGQIKKVTSPSGAVMVSQSDTLGRIYRSWDPLNTRTVVTYDLMNRVLSQSTDSGASTNPLGVASVCRSAEFSCNVAPVAWPTGTPATFTTNFYPGVVGVDSIVSPRSVPRSFRYDASARQIKELDERPTLSAQSYFGGSGLLDSTVSRAGQRVRFRYDPLGRLEWTVWGTRSWPARGPNGSTIVAAATIPGDSIFHQYDAEGRLLKSQSVGRGQGTITQTYWPDGSLKTKVSTWPMLDSLSYWYDSAGAMVRSAHFTYANGQTALDTTFYKYNRTTGNLDTIQVRFVQPVVMTHNIVFSWDRLGRRKSLQYPNGRMLYLNYDAAGTMRRLTTAVGGCAVGDNLCVLVENDSVDLRGMILHTATTCAGGPHVGWSCDADYATQTSNRYYRNGWLARQLSDMKPDSTLSYDAAGNITRKWNNGERLWHIQTYTARTNRLARDSVGTINKIYGIGAVWRDTIAVNWWRQFTYTDDGDRAAEEVVGDYNWAHVDNRYYYYDAQGRMTGLANWVRGETTYELVQHPENCRYDAEGRMVTACGSKHDVAFDGDNVVATDFGLWHFIHGPGTDDPILGLGRNQNMQVDTVELYWVTDGGGRQYAVSQPSGSWQGYLDVDGTGDEAYYGWQQAGGITNAGSFNAARQGSGDTPGLSYFRNRIYDQQSGQWTQEDPLGLAGGLNLYQYAGNNPATYSDPFGLCPPKDKTPCRDQTEAEGKKLVETAKQQNVAIKNEGLVYGQTRSNSGQLDCSGYVCRVQGHPHPSNAPHLVTMDLASSSDYRPLGGDEAHQAGDVMYQPYAGEDGKPNGTGHVGFFTGEVNARGGSVGCAMGRISGASCSSVWGIAPGGGRGGGWFDNTLPLQWYRPQVATGGGR
jgi:RHS repeat-associated protein